MKLITRMLPFAAFAPMLVFAAPGDLSQVGSFFTNIVKFMNDTLVPFVFALAFLVFIWGVFKFFIFGAEDETARETGKTYMLYGIIGFVIMLSVWGIVNLLNEGIGFGGQKLENIPDLPSKQN